ncbi:MAG: putative membrane protein YedE/YeeE [Verrucomicrobiales bacterium]|jgi:uncharacterized membrane protein YedE/YeeE
MEISTILQPLAGGVLIGLGSLVAMAVSGKIPGISGVVAKVIRPKSGDILWRVVFLGGLVLGAGLAFALNTDWRAFSIPAGRGTLVLATAGLLVGFGSRMGGGCTSGHGVCGIGAGAKDGLIYTIVFMATGVATVLIWRLCTEGGLAG